MSFDEPQDTLLVNAARLAAHIKFDDAVLAYSHGLARLREAPRLVNMIVATDVRWRIIGFLLYLDADRERFGSEGGATYSRLLELCMARNEASPRAVKSVLALLQFGRLVRILPSKNDRRIKYYQPTERMFEFVRQWMRYGTAALDVLEPTLKLGSYVNNQKFVDAFSVSGGRAHLEDPIPLGDRVPLPLSSLKSMMGSYSVMLAVILASLEQKETPSHHSIAKRFGLSRSQVSTVMAAGLAQGLFDRNQDGKIVPTYSLMTSFREWISIELAFYSRHMQPLTQSS